MTTAQTLAPLPPGSVIGIVGGGQLGRMLAIAAAQIGYRTHIFSPEAGAVAKSVALSSTTAAYDDIMALNGFAQAVDIITFEFENVPVETIRHLAEHRTVFPRANALGIAQDRLVEKSFARDCGVPVGPYAEVHNSDDLRAAIESIGCPAILKTARDGYDGKGQVLIASADDADTAFAQINSHRAVLEKQIAFLGELSVLLVRDADGAIATWDCPQNSHDDGRLVESRVPAPDALAAHAPAAIGHAKALATALDYVGVMACEFFVTADGPLFNECAPRVHNSGHWTIEGAVTSQFENHIRAICGLPLGSVATNGSAVRMKNLIGSDAQLWFDYLSDPQCHLHLYGKGHGSAGRKMGHATWIERA